jgi:hypothetical protein
MISARLLFFIAKGSAITSIITHSIRDAGFINLTRAGAKVWKGREGFESGFCGFADVRTGTRKVFILK